MSIFVASPFLVKFYLKLDVTNEAPGGTYFHAVLDKEKQDLDPHVFA